MTRPKFYVRINLTREKNYLRGNEAKYDGIVVSANVLESFPKALASFLYRSPKPYIIDPITHIFGPSTLDVTDKRWWGTLAQSYGLSDLLASGISTLGPEAFVAPNGSATDNLSRFVSSCLSYQKQRVRTVAQGLSEIQSFVSGPSVQANQRPEILIA